MLIIFLCTPGNMCSIAWNNGRNSIIDVEGCSKTHHAALLATIKIKTTARAASRLPSKTARLSFRPSGLLLVLSVEPRDLGESHVDMCWLVGWLVGWFVCMFVCLFVGLLVSWFGLFCFVCLYVCLFFCFVLFVCMFVCFFVCLWRLDHITIFESHLEPVINKKTKQKQHIRAKHNPWNMNTHVEHTGAVTWPAPTLRLHAQ